MYNQWEATLCETCKNHRRKRQIPRVFRHSESVLVSAEFTVVRQFAATSNYPGRRSESLRRIPGAMFRLRGGHLLGLANPGDLGVDDVDQCSYLTAPCIVACRGECFICCAQVCGCAGEIVDRIRVRHRRHLLGQRGSLDSTVQQPCQMPGQVTRK